MTFPAALHTEWIKIRSLRSLTGSLLTVPLATAGLSLLACGALGRPAPGSTDFDPVLFSYYGLNFGQLAAIILGVIAMAGEYKNDGIRISLAAVPNRTLFYGAKLAAVGGCVLAAGLVASLISFLGGQALMDPGFGIGIADRGALRAIIGCALYLSLISLLAAGTAALLRSVTGALSVLVPLFLIVPFVVGDMAQGGGAADFLPDRAGQQVLLQHPVGALGPWSGLAVLAGWTALAVAAGWWSLRRRDA
ncbi:ABC transporter permease [Streptomyces sp. ASQP_92]|uniref:ABC transporter permease n=1 Tax=Streptomyces sp. ASQP_92 TaxID=2979116 RepID=UPI0021BE5151|nr:ABC transporter permease [Streptomyces sp. ASQP_92]MCT9088513.1 ABC transporter permease [Streptomyces sp. ASQP_92]